VLETDYRHKTDFFSGMDRIEKLQQFLAVNPADNFVQHALALEYIKLGNDTEARRLFEQLLDRDPAYIGSYYHLGKLLERNNDADAAIKVYEKGMAEAKKAGENHAYGELRGAYEELIF
jgi:Tfp pilus assembly protein PilF